MAEAYLLDKLKSVEQTFQEMTRRLADPDIATNPDELQRVAKIRSSLEETVNTFNQWKEAQEELRGAKKFSKNPLEIPK